LTKLCDNVDGYSNFQSATWLKCKIEVVNMPLKPLQCNGITFSEQNVLMHPDLMVLHLSLSYHTWKLSSSFRQTEETTLYFEHLRSLAIFDSCCGDLNIGQRDLS